MAEDLQGLLDKIQSEGIAKAQAKENEILANAKTKAQDIVANAEKEAAEIIRKAREDAEISETKGRAAIQQAARDVLIALRDDLLKQLNSVTKDCIGAAMTPELMGQIILEMVKAYRAKNPAGEVTVELLLQQADAEKMAALLKGSFLAALQAKSEIEIGGDFSSGIQIGFKGSDVYLDFSDDALKEIICAYVGPKLAAAIKA